MQDPDSAENEVLEAVFSLSSDAIFVLNNGLITRMNPVAARMLGVDMSRWTVQPREAVLRLAPLAAANSAEPHLYSMQTALGTREVEVSECFIPSPRETSCSILTIRDVTDRMQLDRAKTNFVSMVSHELRTPLNSIIGYTDLLLSGRPGPITDHQQEFLGYVRSSSRLLLGLVNDILDLSRIDAGHFQLDCGPLLPAHLLRDVVADLSGLARDAGVDLSFSVVDDLPRVFGDGRRIEQVLINLIGNALKFTPSGGRVIVMVSTGDGEIIFEIQDTGAGIPPEEQPRVFERFYQPAASPRVATKGTGLGLTIAQSLVTAHGGRIWLESEPGAGSTFYFTLPTGNE